MGYIAPSIFNTRDSLTPATPLLRLPPGCWFTQSDMISAEEGRLMKGKLSFGLGPQWPALLFVLAAVPGQLLLIEVDDHLGAADAHLTRWEQGHILRVFPFD